MNGDDVPDCPCWRGKRTHQVGYVIWNVDGQGGDLRLDGFHRGLWGVPLILLVAGQGGECDLDVCAGEAKCAPLKRKRTTTVGHLDKIS